MADDNNEKKAPSFLEAVAAGVGERSRAQRLRRWAIRSVIVVAVAYGIVYLNGPAWLIWLAWAYVALTLVTAFLLSRGPGAGGGKDT
jgi:fatty acid desaturase